MSFPHVGAIDCDVHPAVPGMRALLPYLEEHWREQVTMRGIDGLDPRAIRRTFPPMAVLTGASSAANRAATSIVARACAGAVPHPLRDLQLPVRRAVACTTYISPPRCAARSTTGSPPSGWTRNRGCAPRSWCQCRMPNWRRPRSIARAADKRFVQVLLPAAGESPLGKRQHWPIYIAAERHGLPMCIHAGSTFRHATTENGWPSYYLEDYVVGSHAFQAQLLSLISEGVFSKFPNLTVVLAEAGFTWLPQFMWRAVKTWRAMRAEVPWVDRAPAEIIRDHVRFTLQPSDAPPDPTQMEQTIEQIGSDRFLLFSTDYPHWHFDGDAALPDGLPSSLVQRLLVDNPLETYPRLKETLQ